MRLTGTPQFGRSFPFSQGESPSSYSAGRSSGGGGRHGRPLADGFTSSGEAPEGNRSQEAPETSPPSSRPSTPVPPEELKAWLDMLRSANGK